MPIRNLFHVAIKTNDLESTIRFYEEVIGLVRVPRPKFKHNGAWLAVQPSDEALIHIYETGPGVGDGGPTGLGTTAIDHVSIFATGYHDFIGRFRRNGLDWREFEVPGTTLWQLFVFDPSGVQLELTFDARNERGPKPDMSEGRSWRAGENFFTPFSLKAGPRA